MITQASDLNKKIIDAIKPYVPACVYEAYTGANTTYCTFNFAQDSVEVEADDEALIDNVPVYVHLYTPNDFRTLKKQIRSALKKAGFTYPIVTCLYESDTKLNHIVFGCNILVASEKEGE
jgi:hypothetical protein